MLGTTPAGSVQLQDYYIRPEKMGAPRKDLADAILSYNGNDSQKNGEPFYRPLLQGCPDVPKYPELPFPHSPVDGGASQRVMYLPHSLRP